MSLKGTAETKAALAKVRLEIETAAPTATKAGGEVIARSMTSRAPRRTGALASSIRVDVSSSIGGALAKVGTEVPYDRFVQRGTVYMAPQAYGEDAANDTAGVAAAMAAVYKAAIT